MHVLHKPIIINFIVSKYYVTRYKIKAPKHTYIITLLNIEVYT